MSPEEEFYNVLLTNIGRVTTFCIAVPVVVGFFNRKHFKAPVWAFWIFVLATLSINLFEVAFIWAVKTYTSFWIPYLRKFEIADTNFLNILSLLKDFSILGWAYILLFPGKIRRSIIWISTLLSIASIVDYFWITGYHQLGVVMPTINGIYVVVLPMYYLWFLFRSDSTLSIYKNPYFWFSIAQVVGHLIGLLFYNTGDKIYETDFILFVQLSIARNLITVIRYFVFGYGFYMAKYARFVGK